MAQLNDPAKTAELLKYLEKQVDAGHEWVVYDTDNPINSKYDLTCFIDQFEAEDHAREYQQIFNWHEAVLISSLIYELNRWKRPFRKTTYR